MPRMYDRAAFERAWLLATGGIVHVIHSFGPATADARGQITELVTNAVLLIAAAALSLTS
ncbi:MAG: hypothetical protein LC797_24550 [Chloroflexi bacterium]|nr:hypothetical protein [Chloroflexota bacterium]